MPQERPKQHRLSNDEFYPNQGLRENYLKAVATVSLLLEKYRGLIYASIFQSIVTLSSFCPLSLLYAIESINAATMPQQCRLNYFTTRTAVSIYYFKVKRRITSARSHKNKAETITRWQ
jgi:hypothetical protein